MDHQVSDHAVSVVSVERGAESLRVYREHVHVSQDVLERLDSGIEPFDMADLKAEVVLLREGQQPLTDRRIVDERFFDQDVRASVERFLHDGGVIFRRYDYRHRFGRLQERGAMQRSRPVLRGNFLGAFRVGVGDADEIDTGQFGVHPSVVGAHGTDADADDADVQRSIISHRRSPPQTADRNTRARRWRPSSRRTRRDRGESAAKRPPLRPA